MSCVGILSYPPIMAVCRPYFLTYSILYSFSFAPKPSKCHLKWRSLADPVHGGYICIASVDKPNRKKNGRPSRARMSDEDLCHHLREVMCIAGLPADRAPLVKELSQHGRNDLANIVRRRGYKAVWELVRNFYLCDNHCDAISVNVQEHGDPQMIQASGIEETNMTCSAKSIFVSRQSSRMEDYTATTNGTVKNDMSVQIGYLSKSSEGPIHAVPEYSYQNRQVDVIPSGSNNEVHSAKEEQLLDREWVANQAKSIETNVYFASEEVDEDSSETEIDHLRSMLYQKEVEFAELKQLIEKEKQALTVLQARAQNEIGNVHRVRSSKDAELRAAEEKLSGLKEVEVQYRTNGETVEVTGSFNGWHKQIKMDLHHSSKAVDLQDSCSRDYKLWSTILWLFPGTYEIKFIVDGQWRVDPWREVAANGHVTNNVLRVDG